MRIECSFHRLDWCSVLVAEQDLIRRRVFSKLFDAPIIKPFDILLGTGLEYKFTGSGLTSDLSNQPSVILCLDGPHITPA